MNTKTYVRSLLLNFPGSFGGFFKLSSSIIKDIAEEWREFADKHRDGNADLLSNELFSISLSLEKIADKMLSLDNGYSENNKKLSFDVYNKNLKEIFKK